jgi:hypothetical protein
MKALLDMPVKGATPNESSPTMTEDLCKKLPIWMALFGMITFCCTPTRKPCHSAGRLPSLDEEEINCRIESMLHFCVELITFVNNFERLSFPTVTV